jgi:phosphatidylglycerophosphate synthase
MVGDSWTHKMARVCILPLVNTPVTPNHLTGIRLVIGLAACVCFAMGERSWVVLGGWLWLFSAFLDRADGELARATGKTTPWGHRFDMICDTSVTSLFFLGAGIGLRESWLGDWAIFAGIAGALGVFAAELLAEAIDNIGKDTGEKAYPGIWGFDFDDVLYLFAPVMWLGWQMPFVLGASVGAPAFALLTWYKLAKRRQQQN